jgi:hypothetical protein
MVGSSRNAGVRGSAGDDGHPRWGVAEANPSAQRFALQESSCSTPPRSKRHEIVWNTKVTSSRGGSVEEAGDDRVGHDLLLRGDAALLDLHGVEVLGRPVAVGVRAEELELRLDHVVLARGSSR